MQSRLKNAALASTIAMCGLHLGGCQQMATYPGVEVTAKYQRPAAEPVPTIIAVSAKYIRDHYLDGRDLPINLPEGVPSTVYDKVFTHLDGGRPMVFPDEQAIHFTEIRTRTMNAQVDVIFPDSGGFNQFYTLSLEHSVLEKWHVKSERKWAMGAIKTPAPNYVAPEPEQPKEQTAAAK
jgi:hypothetical protein